MSVRKKNLLEAFQSAGTAKIPGVTPVSEVPAAQQTSTPVSPVAQPAPAPAVEASAAGIHEDDERIEQMKARFAGAAKPSAGVSMIVLVAFALGIVVGRITVNGMEVTNAAEPDTAVAGGVDGLDNSSSQVTRAARNTPVETNPKTTPAASGDEDVAALFDPKNEFTVVVATYGATMVDHAWAVYDFLLAEGIPVFQPYGVGDKLVILAGATERRGDLASTEQRIRALTYNGNDGAFDDAYSIRITDYVTR